MFDLTSPEPYVIVWVDHEEAKVQDIITKISSKKHKNNRTGVYQFLSKSFQFVPVIIEPTPKETLAARAVIKINSSSQRRPDIILVDLYFGDSDDSTSVYDGRDLAFQLSLLYPVPVAVYTAHPLKSLNRVLISADRFAAVLEGITHLCEGESTRLLGDDWYALFNKIISKAVDEASNPPQQLADEILSVIETLQSKATQADTRIAIEKIEAAQVAAQEGEVSKALASLSEAGGMAIEEAKGIGAETTARELKKFKIASDLDRAHIYPWTQLGHTEYLVETERFDGLVPDRIWKNLERYGICLIRLLAYPAEATALEEIVKLLGFPAKEQNDYEGAIKDINPALSGRANSGDTTSELGFHVDGTQDPHQPALLAFQYVRGAKLGANSRFADAAGILHQFDDNERYKILTTLAKADAATFSKLGMGYTGPIFSFSPTGALMCRIRFDSVIAVHEECHEAFDLLKKHFEDAQNESMFLPKEGDIVVFDNWRIMHARDEIYGPIQRHHRRVWVAVPRHEHQTTYQLGIRPVPIEIAAKIKEANNF